MRDEGGAGLLGMLAAVAVAITVLGVLLDVSADAALGWVLLCAAGMVMWGGNARRRRQERLAAMMRAQDERFAQRRRARENRRDARLVRRTGYAMRPVDEHTVLPPAWAEPVAAAVAAAQDFRRTVAHLPAGPVRDRLSSAVPTMEQGARRCDDTARRGAELERQLRRLRARTGRGPRAMRSAAAGPWDPPHDEEPRLHRDVDELSQSVAAAKTALQVRSQRLQLSSLRVAQAALTASLSGSDQPVDGVEEVLRDVAAVARGLQELDDLHTAVSVTPQPRAQERWATPGER